jgi:hypothetical protein
MQKALYLPMLATAEKDLLNETINLKYPISDSSIQLHHIYPRDWCRNNVVGNLAPILDVRVAGRDWVNSVCNLMPLSRGSNNLWKTKNPGQVLLERNIVYSHSAAILKAAFIDEICFNYLTNGADGMKAFWEYRAELMANDFLSKMKITI